MVSHNFSKNLSSPFVVFDNKGGEIFHKVGVEHDNEKRDQLKF
jgi:hypothetical protein